MNPKNPLDCSVIPALNRCNLITAMEMLYRNDAGIAEEENDSVVQPANSSKESNSMYMANSVLLLPQAVGQEINCH